jgi:hypothetical protein
MIISIIIINEISRRTFYMFNRLLTWKKNNSDNVNAKSKVTYSNRFYIKDRKNKQESFYKWDDWASRSGIHHNLPNNQKEYLDRVINNLEREVVD